jgi:hypothetical protein
MTLAIARFSETSATGLVTRYIYDDLGRLIETIIPDLTPNDWTDNPRVRRHSDTTTIRVIWYHDVP